MHKSRFVCLELICERSPVTALNNAKYYIYICIHQILMLGANNALLQSINEKKNININY